MIRKIVMGIALLFFLINPAQAVIRNIQDNYQFVYNIVDTSGNHVTGQTVTIQIKKASNGYWYDFSDDTFKNTGWTNKTTNLTEDSTNGLYYYTFNPPASETTAEEYVFLVDNGDATYGDHQTLTAEYQNVGTGTSTHSAADVATAILSTPSYKLVTDSSGRVTVGSNADKTGYTASTVSDKTGYALTQTFPTNFSSLTISSGGAVTAGTVSDKTGYTVSTVSDKTGYSLSQSFPTNFASFSITSGGAVTAGTVSDKTGYTVSTVSDKTGYALTQAFPTNFSSLSITAGGAVTAGTVSDKTGYALTQTFPTNFSSLTISSGGAVTAGTVSDKTGYSILAGDKDTLVDLVWNEAQAGHTTAATFGKYLDAQVSTVGGGTLTAADVWAYSSRTLTGAGTGDWTSDEKADILAALGITDGVATNTLDTLYTAIRVHR